MSDHPAIAAFVRRSTVSWPSAACRWTARRARRLDPVLRLRPRAARPRVCDLLRAALPARLKLSYADEGEPDAGGGPAPRGSGRSDRRRLGARDARALDTPSRPEQVSFAGPGKTPPRSVRPSRPG